MLTVAGCKNDTITLEEQQNEEYLRNFVTTFGVPAPNHSYSMAQSAGLHVTTKKGGHVTVTAEVGGQEYLFADLDVTPGTHALPVTIPSSVTDLYVKTDMGVHVVPKDATVDIDSAPVGSREGNYIVDDPSVDADMVFIDTNDGQSPYLAFRPSDFLKRYLELTSEGKENLANYSMFKPGSKSSLYASNGLNLPNFIPDEITFEAILSTPAADGCYYIFPVYWQRDREGHKDYKTILHKVKTGCESHIYNEWELPVGGDDPNIPFPNLGYSTTINSISDIDMTKLNEQFTYDDGKFDKAFDPDDVTMVISKGVKVKFKSGDYRPGFAIAIESGFKEDGSFESFSSSSPFYNASHWHQNYYDVPLNTLYLALSSSRNIYPNNNQMGKGYERLFPVPPVMYINDGIDHSDRLQGGDKYNSGAPFYKQGDFFGRIHYLNQIIGFSPAASKPADTAPCDFRDVIYFVMPHVENSIYYKNIYTEVPLPFTWTIAAEDLGGSFDWDFNDAVFTFTDVIRNFKSDHIFSAIAMTSGPQYAQSVRIITVTPKAAGGTMPIYLTYTGSLKPLPGLFTSDEKKIEMLTKCMMNGGRAFAVDGFVYGDKMFSEADAELRAYLEKDAKQGTYILGCELHAWLGKPDFTSQYNVGGQREKISPKSVQFVIPTDLDVSDEDRLGYHSGLSEASKNNQPLFGFSVLVDKDNTLNIQDINKDGYQYLDGYALGTGSYLVGAPSEKKEMSAPQMILVEGDWEWPAELINIKDAYPSFAAWIQDPTSNSDWHTKKSEGKVTKK